MMKATELHYNRDTGIVTAYPHPDGSKFTVTEDCEGIELRAGDDVYVKADPGFVHLEALTPRPLLIRTEKGGGTIEVLTERRADQDVEAAASK